MNGAKRKASSKEQSERGMEREVLCTEQSVSNTAQGEEHGAIRAKHGAPGDEHGGIRVERRARSNERGAIRERDEATGVERRAI